MRNTLLRYSLHSDFIIYLIRILIGFSIGYFLYVSFPAYSVIWTLISIVLVISPDDTEATKIAIDRTKSNLIGSATGILFHQPSSNVVHAIGCDHFCGYLQII